LLAKELAKGSATSEDVAYTAGILHDVGRLALAMAYPTRYSQFILNPEPTSLEILEAERELFGIDHCQAGEILMSRWNIPTNLIVVASQHHDLPRGNDPGVLTMVRYGCRLADMLGFEVVRSGRRATYEDLIAELPGPSKLPADPQELSFRIASKINSIEVS
jgi:HD-like signal output (HDOD) protein